MKKEAAGPLSPSAALLSIDSMAPGRYLRIMAEIVVRTPTDDSRRTSIVSSMSLKSMISSTSPGMNGLSEDAPLSRTKAPAPVT